MKMRPLSQVLISLFIFELIIAEEIVSYENDQTEDGYNFRYETSDGQIREEAGLYEKIGENLILRLSGFYSFTGSDGKLHRTVYEADENGYKVQNANALSLSDQNHNEKTTNVDKDTDRLPVPQEPIISSAAIASLAGGGLG